MRISGKERKGENCVSSPGEKRSSSRCCSILRSDILNRELLRFRKPLTKQRRVNALQNEEGEKGAKGGFQFSSRAKTTFKVQRNIKGFLFLPTKNTLKNALRFYFFFF